jgi:hypothetical protein
MKYSYSYKPAKVSLTDLQIKKLTNGKPVKLSVNQIGKGDHTVLLHHLQHKELTKAFKTKKGYVLQLSPGEVLATHHSELTGTGFFGDLWNGIKSAGKWISDNWPSIKPVVSP